MWVFDGEEWTEVGGETSARTPETARPRYDESMPELQVIEMPMLPETHVIEQVSTSVIKRPARISHDH